MWVTLFLLVVITASGCWLWRGRLLKDRTWKLAWVVPCVAISVLVPVVLTDLGAQKLIQHLLAPAGLIWLGLALAAVLCWSRQQWWPATAWTAAFLGFTAVGNAWLGSALIIAIESTVPPPPEPLPVFDAVFVLGGGTELAPDGTPELYTAGDRLALAAKLFIAGKSRLLVCSGSSTSGEDRPRDLAAETASLWEGFGIPATAIRRIPGPRNTSEEIAAYAELIRKEGWKQVGLITSAWHLPRALRLCRRNSIVMVALPADHRCAMPPWTPLWAIPQARGFDRFELACKELVGMLMGR